MQLDLNQWGYFSQPLLADEIISTKLAFKTKLNIYGGLDKLKARIYMRGNMQIKDGNNNS